MKKYIPIIIVLISLCASFLSAKKYETNKLLIKFKDTASGYSANSLYTEQTIPESIKKLNKANKVKKIKALGMGNSDIKERQKLMTSYSRAEAQQKVAAIRAAQKKHGVNRMYALEFEDNIDIPMMISLYKNDENIEAVQPSYIYKALAPTENYPNDPLTPNQLYVLPQIDAGAGWYINTGNESVVIAILDSGINDDHEDLATNMWPGVGTVHGRNFTTTNPNDNTDDNFGHGSMVAGIAAAQGDNGVGITGIAWNAQLMAVKVLSDAGTGNTQMLMDGVNYAVSYGADILNMSVGFDGEDPFFEATCKSAYNDGNPGGVLLVAANGNDGVGYIESPARFESVIAVGATTYQNEKAAYSNYENNVSEVMAPGGDASTHTVCSTLYSSNNGYSSHTNWQNSGTSYAAPVVSGLCALIKSTYPSMANKDIRQLLHDTAIDLGPVGYDAQYGYGIVNVYNALSLTSTYANASGATLTDVWNFPNPVTNKSTRFSFKSDKGINKVEIFIYNQRGKQVASLTAGAKSTSGTYSTGSWDCKDDQGKLLANGTYIYIIKATDTNGQETIAKGKMSLVN